MGLMDPVSVDATVKSRSVHADNNRKRGFSSRHAYLIVLVFAAAVYLGCIVSPPSLMDDVDAVHAQIARNMLSSGDWVTPRLDGVAYMEKAPLLYWMIAGFFRALGPFDWVARLPVAFSAIALSLVTAAFGIWSFGKRAGLYAGLTMATCVGLFLFTRILLPDVILTLTTALAMWAFLRVLDQQEQHPRLWALVMAMNLGIGLLLKSLIAVVFPVGAAVVYLAITRQLFSGWVWKRIRPLSGLLVILLVAAPWHVLATLRNPPYFAFDLHSGPGQYHGFFWLFFINEQVLRFLNLRYPRDYNTVPRLYFWLFHLVWLFPWSVYLPAVTRLSFRPVDRAGRTRLLALCWVGFVLVFFTFSTTQEYYSMPCYPALALLLGSAMAADGKWIRRGNRALAVVTACAALAAITILVLTRHIPAPGDISNALSHHPGVYSLSMGHMLDLTLSSFAYLRLPLLVAAIAFCIGAVVSLSACNERVFLCAALMMVLFFQAARLALVVFDPYMASRPLAEALLKSPDGRLIVDHHYYTFSSIFFYTNRPALLLNGRWNNLEYGSYAPGAPDVFIDDAQFRDLWLEPGRSYVVAKESELPRFQSLVGSPNLIPVKESGGKVLLTNHAVEAGVQ
ncbi:MAG: glycosyltransferase family 39 protein [Candidatus Korobacteraceae bacterium]